MSRCLFIRWPWQALVLLVLLPGLSGFFSLAAAQQPGGLQPPGTGTAPPPRRPAPAARRGFQVEILEPSDNAIVTGPTRIAARVKADDAAQVLSVTFYVGDQKLFIDQEAPYQTVHDFGPQPRSVVIRVVATHQAGFSVEQSIVTRALKISYSLEVRRVRLTLTAVNSRGQPVTDLKRDDLRLREDGVEQEIIDLSPAHRPLRIALVVDTSGSMRRALPEVQFAASAFVDLLRPDDRAMVIDFDDQVLLLQDLTASREDLRSALMSTYARGGTALYDAIHATLRRLSGQRERKAIVLLSDGGDTSSVLDQDRAEVAARSSDVIIYAIGIGSSADHAVLKSLSRTTGGRALFAEKAADLSEMYQKIAAELRSQYVLTYASSHSVYDGKWRKIDLDYTGPGKVKMRTRRGYYAVHHAISPLEQPPINPAE
ncbi:MAG: VWA domain-containing protein, partial [Acidobacteriota bacterium]